MNIESDVSLSDWCTLGVGGPARWFCRVTTEQEIGAALAWARARTIRVHVLGGGSNVVIADEGFDGLVLQVDIRGVDRSGVNGRASFTVGAGEPWDPFVAATIAEDCAGLECLSGIPGLVGGTPVQNVGAYGQDVSAVITRVDAFDTEGDTVELFPPVACAFGYRTSRFKRQERFIVTRVEFALERHAPPTITYADVVSFFEQAGQPSPSLADVRDAILRIRRRKGMVIEDGNPANRSVGSFFVNPIMTRDHFQRLESKAGTDGEVVPHYSAGADRVKVPAAWLIERAGFPKGLKRERVGVSPFQAQAIVNHGGACATDIVTLAIDIKRAVWEMFEVAIVPEPVFVGFAQTSELQWLLEGQPHG